MESYDGALICGFIGKYIIDNLSNDINQKDIGLYTDDYIIINICTKF